MGIKNRFELRTAAGNFQQGGVKVERKKRTKLWL